MGKLPMRPLQIITRVLVKGKRLDAYMAQFKDAPDEVRRCIKPDPEKSGVIFVLVNRVAPDSEKRVIPQEAVGGLLRLQATECGPFEKAGGSYVQVVCDLDGSKLKPILYFPALAAAGKGKVNPGGHVAIFEAPFLVTLKVIQNTGLLAITKHGPSALGREAWITSETLHVCNAFDALPEPLMQFATAHKAVQERLLDVAAVQMYYGEVPEAKAR